MKNLFLLLLFLGFFSCNNDDPKMEIDTNKYKISLRNQGMENLFSTLDTLWSFAYDKYSRETFCACDTTSIIAFVDLMNNHQELLPNSVRGLKYSTDYSNLYSVFRIDCQTTTDEERRNELHGIIDQSPIHFDEKLILKDLIDDSRDGLIDRDVYVNRYNNLDSPSDLLAVLIENSFGINNFIYSNPSVFDDPPEALWWHIGAGIAGGLGSALIQTIWDTVDDYGLTEDQLTRGMKQSAIGAAVLAR